MKSMSHEAGPVAPKVSTFTGPMWAHLLLLVILATAITYPCIHRGFPLGHSTFTHINYQHFFDGEIAQGDWYPRWIINMNRGLGSGVFFAQYPLPYYVAWVAGKIVPNHWGSYLEARTLGLSLALAAILAALFTYAWCACFTDRLTAMLAAIIYLGLPYFLTVDVYMRVALGEFWAMAILPLTFFFIERMAAGSRRAIPGLALAFALIIVSHLFTAVLLTPVLLLYSAWRVERGQRVLAVVQTLSGLALATGLAGVYTLPFLYHRRFLHPDNFSLTEGANACPLSQMFSYNGLTFPITSGPGWRHLAVAARLVAIATAAFIGVVWFRLRPERWRWSRLILALVPIVILLRGAFAGYVLPTGEVPGSMQLLPWLIEQRGQLFLYTFLTLEAALLCYWSVRNSLNKRLADFLVVLALVSYFLMTSWSQLLWKTLPILWNVQFPWRLNAFLLVATVGLAALAISDLRKTSLQRGLIGGFVALMLWGLVAVDSARLGNIRSAFRSVESYQPDGKMDSAIPIYAQVDPVQALLTKAPADEKVHVTLERGSGTATVTSVEPRSIKFDARCETDCTLRIGQFYYPAWRVRPLPPNVELHAGSPSGLMELSLPAGDYHLLLELPHGWWERLGAWLSVACLLLVLILAATGVPILSLDAG